MIGHTEGLLINDCDIVFVFDIDVQMALSIRNGLLRHAPYVHRPEHLAVLGVDRRDVR